MIPKRLSRLLLLLAAALCLLPATGQTTRAQEKGKSLVTLNVKEKSVGDVLAMIEASTPYIFFYNTADVDKSRKVTLEFTDADLTTVLGKLFEGQENSFKIDGRQVYITKKAAAGAAPQATRSNPTRLSGYVTDREGEPLPGAAIMVKGSKRGVMTDENGAFTIDGIKVGTVLVASSLGMEDLEFTFTGQDNLTIALNCPITSDNFLGRILIANNSSITSPVFHIIIISLINCF